MLSLDADAAGLGGMPASISSCIDQSWLPDKNILTVVSNEQVLLVVSTYVVSLHVS